MFKKKFVRTLRIKKVRNMQPSKHKPCANIQSATLFIFCDRIAIVNTYNAVFIYYDIRSKSNGSAVSGLIWVVISW